VADDDDCFPESDAEFDAFVRNFVEVVSKAPEEYGLTPEDMAELLEVHERWTASYCAHLVAQEDLRLSEERLAAGLAARAALTAKGGKDSLLGVPAAWAPPAALARPPTASTRPTTRPVVRVEKYEPFALSLSFADERTPAGGAFPEGARYCEIRSHVGERALANPAQYTFLALVTRAPYVDTHEPKDAGKRVFYILRWQDTERRPGPWSTVIAATIPSQ
jgi:hypothetical protein